MGADGQGRGTPRRRRQVTLRALGRAAAIAAGVLALYIAFTLPPRALRLATPLPATSLAGAFHVHTNRSDGSGSPDDIAAAAARAGLRFVVLTDHGDGTRPPDPPAYKDGVLVIDAVEISTHSGHVIALGMTQPAPYPLAGEARDVIDDIHRLGGRAIVAHPDSPKPDLRWRDPAVRYDGLEWLNADTEWRDEPAHRLAATGIRSIFRGPESIVSLFTRPEASLVRWDRAQAERRVFSIAGADAHARIGADNGSGWTGWVALRAPGYGAMFGAMAQVVQLDAPPAGDAARDAAAVLGALAAGRSYSAMHGLASPAMFEFFAEQDGRRVPMGGELRSGDRAIFDIRLADARGAGLAFIGGGEVLAFGRGHLVIQRPVTAVAYRVEAYIPGRRVPWIVSNAIFAQRAPAPVEAPPAALSTIQALPTSERWAIEHEPTSRATVTPSEQEMQMDVALGPGAPAGQYGAAVAPAESDGPFGHVAFTVRADRPLRLSVQLRRGERRWRRSVYADTTARDVTIPLAEFDAIAHDVALEGTAGLQLLLVVDTVNTLTGSTARLWLSQVRFAR